MSGEKKGSESEKHERWQTKITSLKDGVSYIFKTKEFSDVKFCVEGRHYFEAHKLILAARSSEFAKILLSPDAPKEVMVDDDITVIGFETLLRFMYTDTLGTNDERAILETYRAARRYEQKILQQRCEEAMSSWTITNDNLFSLLNKASDIPSLKERCFCFLSNHAEKVISSDAFLEATFDTLWNIFESGKLSKVPVFQRLIHVLRWGSRQFPDPVDYELVRDRLLDCNRPLLGLLEFQKLSAGELAEVATEYDGLLKPVEITALLKNTKNPGSIKLPDWCNVTNK